MDVILPYLRAFVCGGVLCLIGQILIDKTSLTPARILVSYVVAGVILGGLGIYPWLVEWGGAGATVPLTGFGYLLAKGVAQAVAEKGALGILTGGITAAAGGITAAVLFGLLGALLFKSRPKS
ncbi:stage V sporulation protein AE [Flavonifractor sp. An82]|uniref:stage V sporulation protein AE n=1 Tax=Flavonifractor sp. An82 TaxID=1965660 RepID=UPI000B39F0C3|nr:stage V sporulation protein AE [Flavonifractor sp. An82]OUN20549.1 stage V sporulation protein AE [Flavonifractor sp. An82]